MTDPVNEMLTGWTVRMERDALREQMNRLLPVLRRIYEECDNYADGAEDASRHDRLCCEISDSLRPFLTAELISEG